jgi:hypothetical protein
VNEFKMVCQRYGEPSRVVFDLWGACFSLRLASGPWAIVGVSGQGVDDHGRPGALAFHGLFVTPREFRKVGFDPFALAGALRREWGPLTSLSLGVYSIEPEATTSPEPTADARLIRDALVAGRRVVFESPGPATSLVRSAWLLLREGHRSRLSVATFAFGNGNQFDLMALPHVTVSGLDSSYVDLNTLRQSALEAGNQTERALRAEAADGRRLLNLPRLLIALACVTIGAVAVGVGLVRSGDRLRIPAAKSPSLVSVPQVPPALGLYGSERLDAGERRRVADGLVELAERFGVMNTSKAALDDSGALMVLISERLRYRGRELSAEECSRLRREPRVGSERERALALHEHIALFRADRSFPAQFSSGPTRWQVDVLSWSFHVEPDSRLSPSEGVAMLADALAVPVSARPSPLSDRYPALEDYTRFLRRFPRR